MTTAFEKVGFSIVLFMCSIMNSFSVETTTSLKMVDHRSTPLTKNLYYNLTLFRKQGIMFGHQDATAYGIGWKYESGRSDVASVTGDYPAVYGWEIGGIEKGWDASLDSVHFSRIRQLIKEAYRRGGVNTVSWHAHNPVTGGNTWDVSNKEVVRAIIPGGTKHDLLKGWLDVVASFFLSLKDDQGDLIPVLFRPYHEHTGNWFWWCEPFCTKAEYLSLWHFTVQYLRDVKQVHNLIYVYSPDRVSSEKKYLERFPGTDYVDVMGLDLYHFNGSEGTAYYQRCVKESLEATYRAAVKYNKPFVFSETGLECVTVDNWFTEVLYPVIAPYRPAYVLVWRNAYEKPNHYYAPYPGHPAANDLIKLKNKEDVFFNKEIPNMYCPK